VLYRANRRRFTSHCHDLDTLAESAQHDLFHHSRHSAHCLNHLYTAKLKPPGAMMLRARGHDFELPTVNFEFNKRNFIVRCLFQYVYGVYTDSVLSGWVVILKILHSGLLYNCSVMCILFMYCCKHVRQHVYNNTLLTYLLTYSTHKNYTGRLWISVTLYNRNIKPVYSRTTPLVKFLPLDIIYPWNKSIYNAKWYDVLW